MTFPHDAVYLLSLVTNVAQGIRWLYRKARGSWVDSSFTSDMATNHLPHIYDALRAICNKLDIPLGDPPPIRFIQDR